LITVPATAGQPTVLREFKDTALVELSRDGRLILASSVKTVKCGDGKRGCYNEILTVYDNASGKPVGELVSQEPPS